MILRPSKSNPVFIKGDLGWVGSADFGDDFLREGCES